MRHESLVPDSAAAQRPAPHPSARAPSQIYRPGAPLAAALILSPALLALIAAGISLVTIHSVPLVVPELLLLLLPSSAAGWVACVSIRTTPAGISSARLFRPWREIPWALIELAQLQGPRVVLISSTGQRMAFIPWLLSDGARLYRDLLVRLPSPVLDAHMSIAARRLLHERVVPAAQGGLTGSLIARPRTAWRAAAVIATCLLAVASAASWLWAPPPLSLILTLFALMGIVLALALLWWCAQQLVVSDDGIQAAFLLMRRSRRMAWHEIALIEHTPGERVLRLRGDQRLICAGPGMLRPADRDLLRAFLHTYCLSRGVPVAQRRWLI